MPQPKSGHVTLLDVARASGFSVSTVSIVLSEAPLSKNVAAATRQRIRAIAAQLGYHPDAHARSLRRRSSQTVGVLAFDLSDPFCIPIVRGIQAGLSRANYLPMVMDAQTQRPIFDSYLNLLLERRVEGVIVVASWVLDETGLLADMRKNRVPMLIVGRDLSALGIDSILVDNESGGAMAMQHLIDLGHRKIAVILGPQQMYDSAPRREGIQRAAQEKALELDGNLLFQLAGMGDSEAGFQGGCQIVQQLLLSKRKFTAVLAFDDLTALGVVRGLTEAGIRVPEDCSVMGFDDVLPAKVCTPAMTTVRQPLDAMGQEAAAQMLQTLRGSENDPARAKVTTAVPELVVRASTLARKRRGE